MIPPPDLGRITQVGMAIETDLQVLWLKIWRRTARLIALDLSTEAR
jgi:hypothetical protein